MLSAFFVLVFSAFSLFGVFCAIKAIRRQFKMRSDIQRRYKEILTQRDHANLGFDSSAALGNEFPSYVYSSAPDPTGDDVIHPM